MADATPPSTADGTDGYLSEPPSPSHPAGSPQPPPSPSSARSTSPAPTPVTAPTPPESLPSPAPPSSRRLAVPCWTHEETLALIDAFRDKWYDLKRGSVRASHWQEVADGLARICPAGSISSSAVPKTSVQCRHKVEKLRKRYRSELYKSLQRDPSRPPTSSWPYFAKMESLEGGGGVAGVDGSSANVAAFGSRRPIPSPLPPLLDDDVDENDDASDLIYDGRRGPNPGSNARSRHHLMANGRNSTPGGGLHFTIPKAVRSKLSQAEVRSASAASRFFKGLDDERAAMDGSPWKLDKRRPRDRKESDALAGMVSALRMLGDGFVRMELRKMELAMEMEKARMEMQLKRTELILDSQRRILDAFLKGFLERKKAKVSHQ